MNKIKTFIQLFVYAFIFSIFMYIWVLGFEVVCRDLDYGQNGRLPSHYIAAIEDMLK